MIFQLSQTDCKTSCLEASGHLLVLFGAFKQSKEEKKYERITFAGIVT